MRIREITENITAGSMGIPDAAPIGKVQRRTPKKKKQKTEEAYPDDFNSKAFDAYWGDDEEHPDAEDHANDLANAYVSKDKMAQAVITDLKGDQLDPEDRKDYLHDLHADISGTIYNGLESYGMKVSDERADEFATNFMKELGV